MTDLKKPGMAKALAKRISQDIDEWCVRKFDDGHRTHLGASLIGHECKRYLWYVFRWCMHQKFDARMHRLFQTGHREEVRFIEYLEGIGCKVWFEDRSQPLDAEGKYPQFRISAVNGHFGGSLDCVIEFPERYGLDKPVLGEFKTNGTGAAFNKLGEKGMALAKPQHFAQTCTYGKVYDFDFVLYMNKNKNDDSLHIELVPLNHVVGERMLMKAEVIIMSQTAPAKLSEDCTVMECKYCDFAEICHRGAPIEKNCRSCKHASPVENKQWRCAVHNAEIPSHIIPKACNSYEKIV